ncbi:hypothetical protein CWO90_36965 [Bradyrhizobium sp. Leo121]|nr:hypothetical protein CWO90_36965 [Bradyrhizobium sp. Leo121]
MLVAATDIAVAAMSTGLLIFQRNSIASETSAIAIVSQSPMARSECRPPKMRSGRKVYGTEAG